MVGLTLRREVRAQRRTTKGDMRGRPTGRQNEDFKLRKSAIEPLWARTLSVLGIHSYFVTLLLIALHEHVCLYSLQPHLLPGLQ